MLKCTCAALPRLPYEFRLVPCAVVREWMETSKCAWGSTHLKPYREAILSEISRDAAPFGNHEFRILKFEETEICKRRALQALLRVSPYFPAPPRCACDDKIL